MFIIERQIYGFSFQSIYCSTTDLQFVLCSCLLQNNRSTFSPSVLFITTRPTRSVSLLFITAPQIYTFSFASGFIRARWVCAFPFGSVCYDKSTLSLSVCLLQRERATVSLSVCLLQRERATVSLSVCLLQRERATVSLSVCLLQRERATVSLSVCLLQRERAIVSLSVMDITTRSSCSFSFCLVY